jgi:SNF family Na+-dependent transporter
MSRSTVIKKQQNKDKITPVKVFEGIIMTLIIVSSIMLVVDNPFKDPESNQIIFLGYVDNCFTILFTLEALVKIIAMGFMFNNSTLKEKKIDPYIRNPWNMLDVLVVAASLLDFFILVKSSSSVASEDGGADMSSNLKSVKALRVLRALRPLRMISRN